MKKTITQWSMVVALTVGSLLNAQTTGVEDDKGRIGVNTNTPRATLDVQPSTENLTETATTNEGIIPPKISKTRLAQIANNRLVEGTIVYIDNVTYTATPANAKVAKVTEKGYYEYNGREWQPLSTNIYGQDGYLTENRRVGLNAKNLNFAGGKIGRNISTPRSAVDLGNYDVLKLGGGIFSVDTNNGLIPPQMTKQYVYTMMEGVTDGIADGTIVYLSDLTAPWKTVCSPGGWLNFPICTDVPADLKPQMSEMNEKGLYIFNTEADKWLPLKGRKYTGTNGVSVSGNTIGLDNTTQSRLEKLNKHKLVPIDQINTGSNRSRITGTAGYWVKETSNQWKYVGLVRQIGYDDPDLTMRLVGSDTQYSSYYLNPVYPSIVNTYGGNGEMNYVVSAYNASKISAPSSRTGIAVYYSEVTLASEAPPGLRLGGKMIVPRTYPARPTGKSKNTRYMYVAPVAQLWYYDE